MHIPEIARRSFAIVVLALASIAFAQPSIYESPALDFRLAVPTGWSASEEMSPDGLLLLQFGAPSGQGVVGVVATPIAAADRAYWSGPRDQLVQDVWSGFLPEVPGAQITQSYEIAVAGAPGSVIDYANENVAGTIVIVVGDVAAFTFFSVGDQQSLATAQGGLEALVGSFEFLGGGGAGSMGTPGAAGGPGAVTPPPASNPLGGGGGGGAVAAGPMGDPHVGVFADERLQLTLAAAAEGLAGELVFDGNRYPVIAQVQNGILAGHFLAGGTSYGFEAQLVGDTLRFVTGESQFALQRAR